MARKSLPSKETSSGTSLVVSSDELPPVIHAIGQYCRLQLSCHFSIVISSICFLTPARQTYYMNIKCISWIYWECSCDVGVLSFRKNSCRTLPIERRRRRHRQQGRNGTIQIEENRWRPSAATTRELYKMLCPLARRKIFVQWINSYCNDIDGIKCDIFLCATPHQKKFGFHESSTTTWGKTSSELCPLCIHIHSLEDRKLSYIINHCWMC